MNLDIFTEKLKELLDPYRFEHVVRVRKKAIELSKIYNAPTDIVEVGAYLHDIAKFFDNDYSYSIIEDEYKPLFEDGFKTNQILHGFAGAAYVKKNFNINNKLILDSIRYHTIGRKNMTLIDKIVYLADAIEDNRNYPGVDEIRKLSLIDLDKALLLEIKIKIKYLLDKNLAIHPNILMFMNSLLKQSEVKYE